MEDEQEWRQRAKCLGHRPHEFLPDDTGNWNETNKVHLAAKELCRRCPVVNECLEFALETGQNWGVWGNTTPRQRRAIRVQRAKDKLEV